MNRMPFDGRRAKRRFIGTVTGTTSGSAILGITFPAAFSTTPVVVAGPGDNMSDLRDVVVFNASVTTTGFAVICWSGAGGLASAPVRVNYIAEEP